MNDNTILRPATLADTETLARLWVIAFPDKFGPILGQNAQAIIHDWLRLSQRHVQTTTLVIVNQVAAGFISLATPSTPRTNEGRWLWHALQLHNGILGATTSFVKIILMGNDHKPGDDEVYIEMLGVDSAWRGRGIARQLMEYAETVANSEGVKWLSLSVVNDNQKAINLYKEYGFEITQANRSRVLKWLTGYRGYYQMAKQL